MRGVTNNAVMFINFFFISTHTPHARRDGFVAVERYAVDLFLLTRLMRGVTIPTPHGRLIDAISTHTPHARRDGRTGR